MLQNALHNQIAINYQIAVHENGPKRTNQAEILPRSVRSANRKKLEINVYAALALLFTESGVRGILSLTRCILENITS